MDIKNAGPVAGINNQGLQKNENLLQSMSNSNEPLQIKDETVQAIQKPATLQDKVDTKVTEAETGDTAQQIADFAVPINRDQWRVISTAAAQSQNPEEEMQRYAAAITYGREYGVDTEVAMQNLNEFNIHQLGKPYTPNRSTMQAIVNSFKAGKLNMRFNDLAYQFKQADLKGEDITGYLKNLDAMGNEISALQDYQPRSIATTALKWAMEGAVPYMIEVGKSALIGATTAGALGTGFTAVTGVALGSLAAASPYTLAAIITMGATVGAVNRTRELEEGAAYLSLRQLGIDKDIANVFSRTSGLIVGAIEAGFGIEAGTVLKAVGLKTLSSKVTSAVTAKMISSGAIGTLAKASVAMGVNATGEATQEAVEEAVDITFTHIAHAIQEMRTDIDPLPDENEIKRILSAGYRGFVSAAVLGGPSAVMDTHFNLKQQAQMKKDAVAIDSKEAFVKRMTTQKPKGVTGETWANTTSELWEKAHKGKQTSTSLQSEEAATNELDYGAGAKPKGSVRRLSTGELYTKEDGTPTTDTSGAEHHRMLVGDPATGSRYGHIEYEISDNTLTINDVRVNSNYESIRREAVVSLAKQYPGYDIQWEAKGENLQVIKESIIESNPRGKDAGLQYYDGVTNVDERMEIDRTIAKAMPNLNASERALGATMVQLTAEAQGKSTEAYLKDNFKDGKMFGDTQEMDMVMQGKKGAASFTNDMKAIIYAGEKADFSTFAHETFHVALRNMGQTEQFRTAVTEASQTPEFTTWLDDHADLFKDSVFDGKDAKGLAEIAADFGSENWGRSHEEFAARLYEGYLADGQTASPKLQGLFKRIAEWMGRIYTTLKHSVALDPSIVEAFDSMIDKDTPLAKASREKLNTKETDNTTELSDNPSILFQEDGKPKLETGFPKRPLVNLFDYLDNIDEYTTIMDTWKSDLEAWVDKAPDLLQFGNEELVHVIHKNVRPDEGPWRSTSFINFKGEWIPSGHSAYDTKYEAVKEGMELKDYRPDILFQEENQQEITDRILEDARGFETWEGLKYYYEGLYGYDMWGEALDAAYRDDEWYQAVFNEANGISETEAKAVEPKLSPEARLADEKQKDAYIKEKLSTDEGIKAFMEKMGWVLYVGFDKSAPGLQDRQMAATVQDLRNTIPELVHTTILANAKRVSGGKAITASSLKRIRTIMTGDNIRYYRDIYADVMEDPQLKPQVIDERLPSIESPGYNLTGFSITDRIHLADSIEVAPLRKAVLSGKEKLEGSTELLIKVMDREIGDLLKQKDKLEQEIETKGTKLTETEKWSVYYATQNSEASRQLDKEMKQIRKLTAENMQIPEDLMKSTVRLQSKIELLRDQMMKNRASERVKATVKRHEALSDLKEKLQDKQKTKDDAKKVHSYKLKLARTIMVKPSDAINYDQAQLIYKIQATIDPLFRQKSMEIEIDGEQQRVTIDEARDALEGVSDEELQMAMGKRLYERIIGERKPLNDWTIEELEETLERVADLRTEGRAILAAKVEQKQIIAQNYQDSIIRSLMATGKYTSQPLVGTKQDQKERNHPKNTARGFLYSTYAMRIKAKMMDNNTEGTAYRLLVTLKRAAQTAEWRATERRMDPVFKVMKQYGVTEKDLYQSVQISLGERKEEYTYSAMMYAWLSQHDESNRNAVAYGNLISKDEKIALNHDSKLIMTLGDARYKQLLVQVQNYLETQDESGGFMAVVKAVQEDFNAQAPRLNEIAIREFNKAMRVVEQYLPIHRKEFSGSDMRQQVAEDLFNAKAGANATGVAKGFQKDRISISADHQTPVNLDLMGVWNKSARQQEHFIAFAEYGRTLNRVFKNLGSRDLENAINRTLGKEMYEDVTEYMNSIINPQIAKKLVGMEKGVKFLRGNLGAAYLTWKLGGLVLQAITSPMPFLGYIRADKLVKAYFDIFSHPIDSIEFIASKSAMMKNRTMNVIIDQILQQSKTYTDNKFVRLNRRQQEIGSMGLTLVDRYAVAGGWLAAYQQKLGELEASGMVTAEADAQAVVYADDMVLKTQPTGDGTELAPLFTTGSEFARAFTQFQTSLNVIWANLTYDVPTAFKDAANKTLPDAVRKAQFSHAVGTIVGYALAGALLGAVAEGHDEDDDAIDKLRNWIYWSFTQATASVPLVGDMVDNIVNSAITGDNPIFFGDEFFPGVTKAFKGITYLTQGDLEKALSNLGQGGGYMAGLPVSGIKQMKKAITETPGALLGR